MPVRAYRLRGTKKPNHAKASQHQAQTLPSGAYITFHNRILSLPGVRKDYDSLTFEEA